MVTPRSSTAWTWNRRLPRSRPTVRTVVRSILLMGAPVVFVRDVCSRLARTMPQLAGASTPFFLSASNLDRQAKRIYELVARLLTTEKVSASSITILIVDRVRRRQYQEALDNFRLPESHVWGSIDNTSDKRVTVETVARFKGLETEIVILWGLDPLAEDELVESLYVGVSRAKSILYLCGSKANCEAVLAGS